MKSLWSAAALWSGRAQQALTFSAGLRVRTDPAALVARYRRAQGLWAV